jgi:hypothetical protein
MLLLWWCVATVREVVGKWTSLAAMDNNIFQYIIPGAPDFGTSCWV